ncbi:proton-transporting V-type ATPase complex assembly regulator TMEM9-like isoform X2 [Dreissena polymorpha]|nr:proton-transporting V-type ATPase complex assembly regulator TMEM9-like isoform X2 [Dreissena polymorpha]
MFSKMEFCLTNKAVIQLMLFSFCLCSLLVTCESQKDKTSFEDARCKCVCQKFKKDENSTVSDQTVFISANADPNNCNCLFVVGFNIDPKMCNLCQCKYENRNTTTIKVVVILIICVISLLLIYMLFLLCLDPLITHRPASYKQHMDEDDQSVSQVPQFEGTAGTRARLSKQKSVIKYVSDEQQKWKSTVQEQRKNIYDKHTMLN